MNRVIAITLFILLFHSTHGQKQLYKILTEYIPFVPYEKNADSLLTYYVSNKDFITDSISPIYLKGELKNFNPRDLQPTKIFIEASLDNESSLFYVVRVCLDTSVMSKKILATEVEKLRNRITGFFSRDIVTNSGKKDKHPYKIYNFYSSGRTFPSMLLEWGYNQSKKFTGYYFAISFFLSIQQ